MKCVASTCKLRLVIDTVCILITNLCSHRERTQTPITVQGNFILNKAEEYPKFPRVTSASSLRSTCDFFAVKMNIFHLTPTACFLCALALTTPGDNIIESFIFSKSVSAWLTSVHKQYKNTTYNLLQCILSVLTPRWNTEIKEERIHCRSKWPSNTVKIPTELKWNQRADCVLSLHRCNRPHRLLGIKEVRNTVS